MLRARVWSANERFFLVGWLNNGSACLWSVHLPATDTEPSASQPDLMAHFNYSPNWSSFFHRLAVPLQLKSIRSSIKATLCASLDHPPTDIGQNFNLITTPAFAFAQLSFAQSRVQFRTESKLIHSSK